MVYSTLCHFCPHLTPKRFTVNTKLVGRIEHSSLNLKSSRNCGLLLWRPQGMVFYALVREHLSPMNRAVEAVENLAGTASASTGQCCLSDQRSAPKCAAL